MLVHVVCLFAMILNLISVLFGFHLWYNSKIFLFVLSSICIFNFMCTLLRLIYSFMLAQQKNKNKSNTKPEEWNNKDNT